YEHLWERLVPEGFVVATVAGNEPASPLGRAAHLVCLARIMVSEWDHAEHLGCDFSFGGHSTGGAGAHLALEAGRLLDYAELLDYRLKAVFGLFPRRAELITNAVSRAPYFVLAGSLDNDVPGQASTNYEQVAQADLELSMRNPKYEVWAYDVPHNAIGG